MYSSIKRISSSLRRKSGVKANLFFAEARRSLKRCVSSFRNLFFWTSTNRSLPIPPNQGDVLNLVNDVIPITMELDRLFRGLLMQRLLVAAAALVRTASFRNLGFPAECFLPSWPKTNTLERTLLEYICLSFCAVVHLDMSSTQPARKTLG